MELQSEEYGISAKEVISAREHSDGATCACNIWSCTVSLPRKQQKRPLCSLTLAITCCHGPMELKIVHLQVPCLSLFGTLQQPDPLAGCFDVPRWPQSFSSRAVISCHNVAAQVVSLWIDNYSISTTIYNLHELQQPMPEQDTVAPVLCPSDLFHFFEPSQKDRPGNTVSAPHHWRNPIPRENWGGNGPLGIFMGFLNQIYRCFVPREQQKAVGPHQLIMPQHPKYFQG